MKTNTNNIAALAQMLDQAALDARPVDQISLQQTITETDAYAIQAASIARRINRGESFLGLKMGFTSIAKMEQMGVHDMIWGRLTDAMLLPNGGTLSKVRFIHPRVEPEICFRTSKAINRELKLEEVMDYVDGVAAAIEVIDSRYLNFKFSLADVIADNCSSAALVVGDWQKPDIDLSDLSIVLQIDGQPVETGSSAAILGNPWLSLVAATRLAAKYGQEIPAGALIMAGAATSAVFVQQGQTVQAEVEQLGEVTLQVV